LFALGVATVVCTATDTAGNQASSSFTVTVISDGSSPPATTPTPTTPTPTGTLPETGGSPRSLLLVAAGLIVIGALLSSRRRRPA
jgi:LPXTG-motif cell wall-anchored protein